MNHFSKNEFCEWNLQKYNEQKNDQTRIAFPEDPEQEQVYGYYLISFEWMKQWRSFINNKAGPPGPIDNIELKNKILRKRQIYGNLESESDLGL